MKYLFLLFSILFFTNLYSQELRTDKFRVIESGIFFKDEKPEYGDNDFIVTITSKDFLIRKIKIFAVKEIQYDVIKLVNSYTDKENISWGVFDCIDDDGNKVILKHGLYKTQNMGYINSLIFTDSDGGSIFYKLKNN